MYIIDDNIRIVAKMFGNRLSISISDHKTTCGEKQKADNAYEKTV